MSKYKEERKHTIVQICSSIQLPSFMLLVPHREPWQLSYHFRGSPTHTFPSFSNGPSPWVSPHCFGPGFPTDTTPHLLFVHSHQSSMQDSRETGLLKHGSCAIPLLQNTHWLPAIYHTQPGSLHGLPQQYWQQVGSISHSPHLFVL